MTHKFRRGDKVGVFIDYFDSYIPAEITSISDNLVNVKTFKNQTFTVEEGKIVPLELKPRQRKEIIRFIGFKQKEEPSVWKGYKKR
ncbi:MAG: hypothetical protein QXO70_04815 [Candidatus Pacearchaeota archaeon]